MTTGGFSTHTADLATPTIDVLELLGLERLDDNVFRSTALFPDRWALYGGQVCAQALLAASYTTPQESAANSLSGYFLRPGNAAKPVIFQVERDHDGRTYAARRVVAIQGGEVVLNLASSFQRPRQGDDLTFARMPSVAPPAQLPPGEPPVRLASFERRVPAQPTEPCPYPRYLWLRCTADVGDEQRMHQALLAYVSDYSSGFGCEPVRERQATISHALWFHRPVRVDQWLLLALEPQSAFAGRAVYTGTVWTESGTCVATLTQETLYLRRNP